MAGSNSIPAPGPDKPTNAKPPSRNPWAWVPTLYLAEGLPFAVVNSLSVVMYKNFGVSNANIAFYTAWLYLPWVIKPVWSPVVDILRTRRWWIWTLQLLLGAGFAAVGLALPLAMFFKASLAIFYLVAFASATHDIAADGYYLLATTEQEQAFFVGIRSTFYRISMVAGQGLLVILAGVLLAHSGLPGVPLRVETKPEASLVETMNTNEPPAIADASDELRVVSSPETISIRPQERGPAEITGLIATARNWNLGHGFSANEASSGKKDEEPSWWTRNISQPAGKYLATHFGRGAKPNAAFAGNIGVARLRLSKPPGREVVVTLAQKSGDKSISLAEGSRLIFSDANWNQPAFVILQLDPKLKQSASAVFDVRSGNIAFAWATTFFILLGLFAVFGLYHRFMLPHPVSDQPGDAGSVPHFIKEFFLTFGSFFKKPKIGVLLMFLLVFRFGEAQLVKMVTPFLLDAREAGGLGLTTDQVGLAYGIVGILALTIGGLLGGFVASRHGLKAWLWLMVCIIHLPDAIFIYLAFAQPSSLAIVSLCVAVEQFGYGFGFTAYMLYMIYIARGRHQTAHYAICTGFMALGMMIPGMWSGWLQEILGYRSFFVWVIMATIPSFLVVLLVPLDAEFGKRNGNG